MAHTSVPPKTKIIVTISLMTSSSSFVGNVEENRQFRRTNSYDALGEIAQEQGLDVHVSRSRGAK